MNSDTDITNPATPTPERANPYLESERVHAEKQFTDYLSDFGDAVVAGTSRGIDYLTEHPLLTGSIAVGGVGAFAGSKLGHMLAMRRRKSFYDRTMDNIGLFVGMLGTAFSRQNREKAMERLAETGRGVLGTTQDLSGTLMERVPVDQSALADRVSVKSSPSALKQIGYGLSLIPVTMALVRNPLIRSIGLRFLARRIRSRRRR